MAREAAVWFVMVGGEQDGPLTRSELGLRNASGALTAQSQVWREAQEGWLAAADVPELAALFQPAPMARPASSPGVKAGAARPPPEAAPKPKTVLKPVASATSRTSERAAGRGPPAVARAPEPQPKKGFGEGASEFNTGHFRLADLDAQNEAAAQAKKGFGEGASEFNTGHFRLADLAAQKEAAAQAKKGFGEGASEFNTAHFKLSDLGAQKAAAQDGFGKGTSEFNTAHFRLTELQPGQDAPLKRVRGEGQDAIDLVAPPPPPPPEDLPPAPKPEPPRKPGYGKKARVPFSEPALPRPPPPAEDTPPVEVLPLAAETGEAEAPDLARWASSELGKSKPQSRPGVPRAEASPLPAPAPAAAPGAKPASSPGVKAAPASAKAPSSPGAPRPASASGFAAAAARPPSSPGRPPPAVPDAGQVQAAVLAARAKAAKERSLLPQAIALGVGVVLVIGVVLWLVLR